MQPDREEIIEILSELCPGVDFENSDSLIDDELIDSLDIISIVTELMDKYDIEISVDDLVPENFNSVDDIIDLVKEKL
jgi:acyl carrier protein